MTLVGDQRVIVLDSEVGVSRVHAGRVDLPFRADAAARTLRVDLRRCSRAAAGSPSRSSTPPGLSRSLSSADRATTIRWRPRGVHDVRADLRLEVAGRQADPADRALSSIASPSAPTRTRFARPAPGRPGLWPRRRVVRYKMDRRCRTSLMAFAAGRLDHVERVVDGVPASVWYRRASPSTPG